MSQHLLETRVIVAADKARRWRSGHSLTPMRQDMDYISGVMLELVKETDRLNREVLRLKKGRSDTRAFCRPAKRATNPRVIAAQIAESAGDGPVSVYRVDGELRWGDAFRPGPKGGELIGTYDAGADRRAIAEDITA